MTADDDDDGDVMMMMGSLDHIHTLCNVFCCLLQPMLLTVNLYASFLLLDARL